MQPAIARAMFQLLEPIATVAYFAPELQDVCARLGLTAHRMSYYAPRAAALGPVAAEVVAACFFHHPMALVRPAIPRAWRARRRRATWEVVCYMRRMRRCPGRNRRISSSGTPSICCASTAAMGTSSVSLAPGSTPARRRQRSSPAPARTGQDDEAWNAAVGRLQARGWLDANGHPTATGRAGRNEVERSTDQLAMRPWEQLGCERTHRLWALLNELVDVIATQHGVPLRTPLGVAWPARWPAV